MPGTTARLGAEKPASSDLLSSGAGVTAAGLDTVDAAMWIHKGAWSSVAAYATNDVVDNDGVTYLAIAPSTNHVPPNGTYWRPLVAGSTIDFGTLMFLRANF